jgi:peptide/nickel transport system permease protein
MARSPWLLLLALVIAAAAVPFLPWPDPLRIALSDRFAPPLSLGHLLGADELGRDLLSRCVHGLATTLLVAIGASLAALALGGLIGGYAGSRPGSLADLVIGWLGNLFLSLPFLLVMAGVLSLTTPSLLKAYTVLAGMLWMQPARIVRTEIARRRDLGYILAARALGMGSWRILLLKLLPAALPPAAVLSLSYLPEVVALEAGLSFLGMGVRPPAPGIGKMIFDGLPYLSSAWWVAGFPALLLLAAVAVIHGIAALTRLGTGP